MIVILGDMQDMQVKLVAPEIEKLGVPVRVVDYLAPSSLSVSLDQDGDRILLDGEPMGSSELAWYRFKIPMKGFDAGPEGRAQLARNKAWISALTNLCAHLGDRVVNTFASTVLNDHPLWQLPIARACGFTIPPTRVSNDFAQVKGFSAEHRRLIVKSLGDPYVAAEDQEGVTRVMTMRVDADLLAASEEGVKVAPTFFQREIPKAYELRVVVYGDTILPFRVDSQQHNLTKTDWRYGNRWLEFEPCKISGEIQAQIREFMKRAGLFEGQFDFVVTPTGQYVFLECNPQGAWGWLEKFCDGAIARAAAAELCRRAEGAQGAPLAAPAMAL